MTRTRASIAHAGQVTLDAMVVFVQIIFGVIPAFVMTVGAMMLLAITADWHAILFLGAVLGTIGLCWAIFGYEQASARKVLILLVIGEITMLTPFASALLLILSQHIDLWRMAALGLTFGPAIIGAAHILVCARRIFCKALVA
jgi:hypothetical protein